jgi:hypothetical protein
MYASEIIDASEFTPPFRASAQTEHELAQSLAGLSVSSTRRRGKAGYSYSPYKKKKVTTTEPQRFFRTNMPRHMPRSDTPRPSPIIRSQSLGDLSKLAKSQLESRRSITGMDVADVVMSARDAQQNIPRTQHPVQICSLFPVHERGDDLILDAIHRMEQNQYDILANFKPKLQATYWK